MFKSGLKMAKLQSKSLLVLTLLFFSWFSTQAPVTPALSALVNRDIPVGTRAPGSGNTTAEDLTPGSVYEHLSIYKRKESLVPTGLAALNVNHRPAISQGHARLTAARDFSLTGRQLLATHCILRT